MASTRIPVLTVAKRECAKLIAPILGINPDEAEQCIGDVKTGTHALSVPVMRLRKFKIQGDEERAKAWAAQVQPNEWISKASTYVVGEGPKAMPYMILEVNMATITRHVLQTVLELKDNYGSTQDYAGKTVLVEFSSPNIAKPFHAGHLRSTVIGNFLKNVFRFQGANVIGINYLGDWGTQYGLLALGFLTHGSEEKLLQNPIRHLFDVYVAINEDAERDATVKERARQIFKKMEDGDEAALATWLKFRDLSIAEYKKIYKRLNVDFDVYSGESLHSEGTLKALDALQAKNLLVEDDKGGVIVDLKKHKLNVVVVKKKDGAALYITRDIASAKARHEQYNFDKSIYVVGNQQDLHFKQLFKVLELMEYDWAKKCVHVGFGMVNGMKTREGNVVFLEDILNEAKAVMLEHLRQDNMGKLSEIANAEETADIIGLSAVVIQDLSAKRIKDYDFDWKRMTKSDGHTGPYLQYAHCRLCSLEDKTREIPLDASTDLSVLTEKSAHDLVVQIAKFPIIIQDCAETYEPATLVNYLFDLAHAVSSAHADLRVMGAEVSLAKARKLLFWAARVTLGNALTLLGLIPLTRM